MLVYIAFFVCIMVLAIDYEFNGPRQTNAFTFLFIATAMALLAGLRASNIDKDYGQYLIAFDLIYFNKDPLYLAVYEPSFCLIVFAVRTIFSYDFSVIIMLIYAFSAVFMKVSSFRKYALNPFLVCLFYFSQYFFLQEMTQIRIGLAVAIFLVSLKYFFENNIRMYVALILLAACFHYTAIFYLALFFLRGTGFNKWLYIMILCLSVVFVFYEVPLITYLGNLEFADFAAKIEHHVSVSENTTETVNVFNLITIFNALHCLYLIVAVTPADFERDKKLPFFLKCSVFSIFFLSFLSGVPTIAFRISDLPGILSIFSFVYLTRYLPFGRYNIFILIIIAGLFFYFHALSGTLVRPYKMYSFNIFY